MKQRVGLARALAMEPKVLLLDEPFGALDALHPRASAGLGDGDPHHKLGNTVLMITHDVDEGGAAVGPHRDDDQRARSRISARFSTCRWRVRAGGSRSPAILPSGAASACSSSCYERHHYVEAASGA